VENLKDTAWVLQCAVFGNAISFVGVLLVLPRGFIVAAGFFIKTGKETIQIFRASEFFIDKMGCIGVVHHVVFKPQIMFDHVVNQTAQQNDVGPSTNVYVLIGTCWWAGKARCEVNELGSALFGFSSTSAPNRMSL